MQLRVIYQDRGGNISNQFFNIIKPVFIKHMGIAGMGYAPRLHKLRRIIGMFLHYSDYFRDFSRNRFSEPVIVDPTEKGQFSNLVGKAIADYLSKKLNRSFFTIAYEFAMREKRIPIIGRRPDLIAFSRNSKFAIEAKGFSKSLMSDIEMNRYKSQALSGPISVNFAVASVSYNLYNSVICRYYDPPTNRDFGGEDELLKKLFQRYYAGFKEFINEKFFEITEEEYQKEDFYILTPRYENLVLSRYLRCMLCLPIKWSLILTKKIDRFAEEGINSNFKPFKVLEEKNLYIDVDRIGVKLIW